MAEPAMRTHTPTIELVRPPVHTGGRLLPVRA